MGKKPKPVRWIGRFKIRSKDELHMWLMRRVGLEAYLSARYWKLESPDELPLDLAIEWFMNYAVNDGVSDGEEEG